MSRPRIRLGVGRWDHLMPLALGEIVPQSFDLELVRFATTPLLTEHPEYRDSVRLLMIGSGAEADEARSVIVAAGFGDAVRFTGLVEQREGPAHLAACDILVSPHVPNADGSPFLGSPTQL